MVRSAVGRAAAADAMALVAGPASVYAGPDDRTASDSRASTPEIRDALDWASGVQTADDRC